MLQLVLKSPRINEAMLTPPNGVIPVRNVLHNEGPHCMRGVSIVAQQYRCRQEIQNHFLHRAAVSVITKMK